MVGRVIEISRSARSWVTVLEVMEVPRSARSERGCRRGCIGGDEFFGEAVDSIGSAERHRSTTLNQLVDGHGTKEKEHIGDRPPEQRHRRSGFRGAGDADRIAKEHSPQHDGARKVYAAHVGDRT